MSPILSSFSKDINESKINTAKKWRKGLLGQRLGLTQVSH